MSRSAVRLLLTLVGGLALLAVPGIGAAAQDATPMAAAPHPSHIHVGTCAELDPNPTYGLNDVTAVAPDAGAVETATTTVDASLDDLLASPFAINVHASAEDLATYISCGDIAGTPVDGTLLIALHAQNDSGDNGVAVLTATDAGTTDVSVYLVPDSTPVAGAVAIAAAHPSHIHVGTCAELDPNPTYGLNDVAAAGGDGAVETATTTVDASLDDLLASPFAINVHASADDLATYIACGDIAGTPDDSGLVIALRAQNDSGYNGVAVLTPNEAGTTDVAVYLTAPAGADATPAAASAEVAVDIKDFAFSPQVLEIPVGTTVTWTNQDVTQHTVVSNGVWQSDILQQGDTFSYTFDEPGTFDYICSLHPNMTGQVVVTG